MKTFQIQLGSGKMKEVPGTLAARTDGVLAVTEEQWNNGSTAHSITVIASGLTIGGNFKSHRRAAKIANEFWSRLTELQKQIVRDSTPANTRDWPAIEWYQEQLDLYGWG